MAKSLESILAHVNQDRRGFLKTLLVSSAVAAVPLMMSEGKAQAQDGKGEEGKKKKGEGKKKEP